MDQSIQRLPRDLLASVQEELAGVGFLGGCVNDLDDTLGALLDTDGSFREAEPPGTAVTHLSLDETVLILLATVELMLLKCQTYPGSTGKAVSHSSETEMVRV